MQGQIINGFELKRLLGRGGMAEVWYAENEIGKPAAVKILNENLSHNQQIVERFHNEALVMVKLDHPNIREVYGYGYLGNRHCIIMEYLEGEDLEELMKNGRRFTEEELRRWWNQTVDALNYTHAMGIVHRDIKPSNIFLDEKGNIKVLDFGIAKMMENASLTQTGMVMGTPMYMSPEQVNDIKHVDYHTDLYSLAVSFVHMLTGKKPYDDTNCSVFEIQMSIVTKPLDMSEVPATWQGFLAPYLEKDPQKRPALRSYETVELKDEPVAKTQTASEPQPAPTVVAPQQEKPAPKPQPKPTEAKAQPKSQESKPQPSEPSEKPKSKKGLWIGLGVVAVIVAVIGAVIFMKEKREAERYGITLSEAFERLDNCIFQDKNAKFEDIIGRKEAWCLVFGVFHGDEEVRLLKKTLVRNAKKLNLPGCGLATVELPYVIDLMEAVYDCQGYEASSSNNTPQQNTSYSGGVVDPVHWTIEIKDRPNNEFDLVATATIDPDYCIYSTTMPELAPLPTVFDIKTSEFFEAVGTARDLTDVPLYYDELFETEYKQFTGTASFAQTFRKLKKGTFPVRGEINCQACKDGMCINLSEDVNLMCQGLTEIEEKADEGMFSVSASRKVRFAKGNLQYQASTGKWRFAPNPWDVIGEANENISPSYSGWIDLFGWGTGDNPTKISKESNDYSPFVDWGSKYGGGWRTLTEDEWRYVLRKRNTASGLRWAEVTLNGVKGFILLPDDWNGSTFDLTCTNQTSSDVYTPEGNTISVSTWNSTFEPAGAVFLPAAGYREKNKFETVEIQGYYWTSTSDDDYGASCLYIYDCIADDLQITSRLRSSGFSVRLVCPAK